MISLCSADGDADGDDIVFRNTWEDELLFPFSLNTVRIIA